MIGVEHYLWSGTADRCLLGAARCGACAVQNLLVTNPTGRLQPPDTLAGVMRERIPARYRRRVALGLAEARQPTAALRRVPEFVVIGAQRAGTSSMFRYLSGHPQVRRPLRKEIDYFSAYYDKPEDWYRAHFPIRRTTMSFDCTPQYFVHPLAPRRSHHLLPQAKLVVMVRDPVARLLSHFSHMQRLGFETLGVPAALAAEAARVGPDLSAIDEDPGFNPKLFFRFSYLARSKYGEQFDRWLAYYPRSSFHVLDFDGFVRSPQSEWWPLLDFLQLEPWTPIDFRNWSTPTLKPVTGACLRDEIRERLVDDSERFASLAGRSLSWMHERDD